MLRHAKEVPHAPSSRALRAATIGLLAAAGLLSAGLRGPSDRAQAAPPPGPQAGGAPTRRADSGEFDLNFVPDDASLVLAARPAALLARPELKRLADALNELAMRGPLVEGLKIESIDQVVVVGGRPRGDGEPGQRGGPSVGPFPLGRLVVRATAPRDWKQQIFGRLPQGTEVTVQRRGGRDYHRIADRPGEPAFVFPDDRTVIVEVDPGRLALPDRTPGAKPNAPWAESWSRVARGQAALAVDMTVLGDLIERSPGSRGAGPLLTAFGPLWEESTWLVAGADATEGVALQAVLTCANAEGGEKVARTLEAARTLASNALQAQRRQPAPDRKPLADLHRQFLDLADELLTKAKVERDAGTVRLRTTARFDLAQAAVLMPAVEAAREASRRAQSVNNLKQIALAMHNFHDTYKRLPPAVGFAPDDNTPARPDGKPPVSWRVLILPYIEQDALYKQYRFDEAWDGPNNIKLLDKMPAIYRVPGGGDDPTHTSYFTLTGPAALFPSQPGVGAGFADVLDGLSNTILVVESRRPVPWTKPQDIPYDPFSPVPQLGGYFANGFNAAFGDGAVRFLSQTINEQVLRALITKAGGEVISSDALNVPPGPQP